MKTIKFFLIVPFLFISGKWSSPLVSEPESSFILSDYEILIYYNRFDSAVAIIKQYEGWHTARHYPYVGYGHKLQKGDNFDHTISKPFADSLLRQDLLQKCAAFRRFGKDSLLLGVLAYNIGEYRLLGTPTIKKSTLIAKLEAGNRDIQADYISYRKYKGKVIAALERRRRHGFNALYEHP